MSKQPKSTTKRSVVLVVVLAVIFPGGTLVAKGQQPAGAAEKQPATAKLDPAFGHSKPAQSEIAATPAPSRAEGTALAYRGSQGIRLRVDGNLAGRVCALDPTGQYVPVRAKVAFIRNAQVIGSARTDEMGNFQVSGLRPGVYSLIAVAREGLAAVSVRVLPFERAAADPTRLFDGAEAAEPPLLEIAVIPFSDYQLAMSLVAEELGGFPGQPAAAPPAPQAPQAGAPGGGGEGFAPLLGLGGLAGLAGLGGAAGGAPASPSKP